MEYNITAEIKKSSVREYDDVIKVLEDLLTAMRDKRAERVDELAQQSESREDNGGED